MCATVSYLFLSFVVIDSNVSVSVSAIKLHNSVESDRTALIWNLTSPCRLETELWLCRKGSSVDSSCNQINDMHHAHKYQKRIRRKDKWIRTDAGHWVGISHQASIDGYYGHNYMNLYCIYHIILQ